MGMLFLEPWPRDDTFHLIPSHPSTPSTPDLLDCVYSWHLRNRIARLVKKKRKFQCFNYLLLRFHQHIKLWYYTSSNSHSNSVMQFLVTLLWPIIATAGMQILDRYLNKTFNWSRDIIEKLWTSNINMKSHMLSGSNLVSQSILNGKGIVMHICLDGMDLQLVRQ